MTPYRTVGHYRTVGRPNICTSASGGVFVAPCPSTYGSVAKTLMTAELDISMALNTVRAAVLEALATTQQASHWSFEGGPEALETYMEEMQAMLDAVRRVETKASLRGTLLAGEV